MSVWLKFSYRPLLFYEENKLLDVNVRNAIAQRSLKKKKEIAFTATIISSFHFISADHI